MSKIVDKVYSFLPVWLQNVGISAYGYYWYKRRFGGVFKAELKAYNEREFYTKHQWDSYQTEELRKLLVHAFDHVPFYTEKYTNHGITREFLQNIQLAEINKLPFLEKEELRKYGTTTLLSKIKDSSGEFYGSSGTTGTPTQIYFSKPFHQKWSAAFESRIRKWAGIDYKTPRGMIGGRRVLPGSSNKKPFYRYNWFEKQVYFSAYHISPSTVENYLHGIKKYKLEYMNGYAVSNYSLAKFLVDGKYDVPKLKAVITSSEKLNPEMREVFQQAYGCKTFDSYSGVEACGLISETEKGELLVSPDVGIMEFLDSNGNEVKPGEAGEIISTGLINYDQPLIRYRIGDTAILSKTQETATGHAMIKIDEIQGRIEDKVVAKDGREMVRFHGLYINIPHLITAQIIQNDYDVFTFNLVVEEDFDPAYEEIIIKRLESQVGKVKTTFNHVSEIPKSANGKFRAVISEL